jgi:hypothetical protein
MKTMEQKRTDAHARQVEYESLTLADRLARLDKYGFAARKERIKIEQLMNALKPPKTKIVKRSELNNNLSLAAEDYV